MGLRLEEFGDDGGVVGFGAELVSAGDADKLEGRGVVELAAEFFEGVFDFVDGAADGLRQLLRSGGAVGDKEQGFDGVGDPQLA